MIYAPIIDSTIPAFTEDKILVPFGLNPAVSKNEVTGYGIQIKDMNTGSIVRKGYAKLDTFPENYVLEIDYTDWTDTKEINNLTNGTFYKIQIAFLDNFDWNEGRAIETNIKFSDVTIGRCIITPQVYINNWQNTDVHNDTMYYEGHTKQFTPSETVGQYRFEVIEVSTGMVIQDSGWQAHNSDSDKFEYDNEGKQIRITTDNFELLYELGTVWYKIRYSIKTNNGYEAIAENYIVGYENIESLITLKLEAIHSGDIKAQENGYVLLKITPTEDNDGLEGQYKIRRMKLSDGVWENIFSFELENKIYDTTQTAWLDLTVEQGEFYSYKLIQYLPGENAADNNFAATEPTEEIYVDFEAIFLSDNEKQLCIKYNPKISSFKETIQEAKQDTLGGQYPYFFRNGNLRYKEIPLNGLISYHMDENEMFITKESMGLVNGTERKTTPMQFFAKEHFVTTSLANYNIAAERKFKLAVLEWLNNGKPKLFRSPTEGNYVIRIMNVSLSPTDTVGRMLHSFSGTGYEIADTSYASLMKYNLILNNREVIDNAGTEITN